MPTEGNVMSVPKTRVVHVKRAPCDVYVGRPSPFGNPFVIGRDGDRGAVIRKYRTWLLAQPALASECRRTGWQGPGCWCAPLPCHGDVLADVVNDVGAPRDQNAKGEFL
jgi:hypothetical protein